MKLRGPSNLEILGQFLADDYISKHEDLTENLVKTSSKLNLNKEQIRRVAEAANVETYIKLSSIAKDGYVEFPLADVDKVYEKLSPHLDKEANSANDYTLENSSSDPLSKYSGSSVDTTSIQKEVIYDELAKLQLNDQGILEQYANTINKYAEVEKEVIQLVASGHNFDEVSSVIKEATASYSDQLLDTIINSLKDNFPTEEFNKEASVPEDYEVNKSTNLYKLVKDYEKLADSVYYNSQKSLVDKLKFMRLVSDTPYEYLKKEAGSKLETFKEIIKKFRPFKNKTTTTITTGAITLPIGYNLGRKKSDYEELNKYLKGN